MGRRSSRAAPRAAPRRAASTSARRSASPAPARRAAPARSSAPAPAKSAASTAPSKAGAPAPAAAAGGQGSAMGGFMANVASTGLGVMAGRAMDRAFFGGGGSGGEAPAESPMYDAVDDGAPPALDGDVCAREILEFRKCLERTGTDMAACKWNLDILTACQQREQEIGFADAGRF